jgi:hypothetical protein
MISSCVRNNTMMPMLETAQADITLAEPSHSRTVAGALS